VEIPVPPRSRLSNGVTQEDRVSGLLDGRVSSEAENQANPVLIRPSCDAERNLVAKSLISHCQEKRLARMPVPVPQTDTGRRGENPKVRGITLVKELGKMAP
jgi:hypothetical protein